MGGLEISGTFLRFQGDLLRSKKEFRDPRGDFDIPEEPSEISRTVLRYYGVYQILERSSGISGRVLRSQGVFRDLKLAF